MSEQPKLGKLLSGNEQRDAIHIAIAPVIADETLVPGARIGFSRNNNVEYVSSRSFNHIGIVDPYLENHVQKGERFYMFLFPQTITSLRHDWTHPSFSEVAKNRSEHEKWITDWAMQYHLSFDQVMRMA